MTTGEDAAATDQQPAEPEMDIHKPHPVHNWREFLSEVGIIVIGVLIALAGEQLVVWLHWHEKAAQAREAIGSEVTDS